jgi:hypothetical protein
MRRSCAEVVSLASTPGSQSESGDPDNVDPGRAPPQARVLVIDTRVDGFFLQRFDDRGELVGETQHDTADEAEWQAYSEYVLSDWLSCPDDVDPLEYIRGRIPRIR